MSHVSDTQQQMADAFALLKEKFSPHLLTKVQQIDYLHKADIKVKMDDGSEKIFTAYRAQHTNVKWPYKWGIRRHQDVSEDEVSALSMWMSIKTSALNLPLGGGKGGIIVDPTNLSTGEKERLARAYMQSFYTVFWPHLDVPAPDVNTNGQIMGRMLDEYSKLTNTREPSTITGKPLSIGGSEGRVDATGRGGVITLETFLAHQKKSLKDQTLIVQWSGNVGLHFARIAAEKGGKIIGISDISGGIFSENGIDMKKVVELKEKNLNFDHAEFAEYKKLSNDELLLQKTDILVPAALEDQLTKDNAENIQAGIILEMANGPTTKEWAEILHTRHIPVIPDVLANAGGVSVSYFEQVQNTMNYYRKEEEVHAKLQENMEAATKNIIAVSEKYTITLKQAAYVVSLERILQAMHDRGR